MYVYFDNQINQIKISWIKSEHKPNQVNKQRVVQFLWNAIL